MKSGNQYVKETGRCPRCDSGEIEGGSITVDGIRRMATDHLWDV